MEKYVAFLRGINVGGKNKIAMADLRALFEQNAFFDVMTYINSGNVIFSCDRTDERKLKETCEALINHQLRLNIPVTVISVEDLFAAVCHAPLWWGQDAESKHNAIFILPPVTVADVFKEVGQTKPEYEKVDYSGNVVFWSAPIKTFSRIRWSKIVGSTVCNSITIRNANTVKKILELVK